MPDQPSDARLERFAEFLAQSGLKTTRQRERIVRAFFAAGRHISAEELYHQVHGQDPGIGLVTVYRTLKLLARMGYANEVDFGEGARRYESNLASHHDHLVCTACGNVIEFKDREIEKLQDMVTRRHGFRPTAHRLEIFGRCRRCAGRHGRGRRA